MIAVLVALRLVNLGNDRRALCSALCANCRHSFIHSNTRSRLATCIPASARENSNWIAAHVVQKVCQKAVGTTAITEGAQVASYLRVMRHIHIGEAGN